MHTHCDYCGLTYEREQGYFVGAIYLNVIATESLLLIYALIAGNISQIVLTVLIVLALALPLLFFHHSRSVWLCVDHILNPTEGGIKRVDSEGNSTSTL